MSLKQFKLKQLRRMLLLLLVCLLAGNNVVLADAAFSDIGLKVYQQPSKEKPYMILEVLYFDAMNNDSYFTTAVTANGEKGPAVYVDGNYICSPYEELAWDTHQKTAESDLSQDGWWSSNNPEKDGAAMVNTYENNGVIIRFYDPHRNSDEASGHYYVYMYVFLKEYEVGSTHKVKIEGTWKVRGGTGSLQSKEVNINSFSLWSTPTAVLTADKKVMLTGSLVPGLNGKTTVGLYTKGSSTPSGYCSTTEFGANKTFNANVESFTKSDGLIATFDYDYDRYNGGTIPVQFSYEYNFSLGNWTPRFDNSKLPIVYKWMRARYPGFVKPANVRYTVTDQWKKKVEVRWDVEDKVAIGNNTYDRSHEGKWMIKNGDKTVRDIKYANTNGIIEINEYSQAGDINEDQIEVFFVPLNYSGDPISSLSDNVNAKITPNWSFTSLASSENESQGIDLNWTHNAFEDASDNHPYTITIQRSTDYNTTTLEGTWENIMSNTVKESSKSNGSCTDANTLAANTTYYYRLKTTVMGMDVYSPVVLYRLGGSQIKTFSASRGNYSNMVKLQWTVKQAGTDPTNFILKRRPLGSESERDWVDIYTTSGTVSSYSYDDVTAQPGSFNDYKIVIWSEVVEKTGEGENATTRVIRLEDDSETTDGFSISTGIISGNIAYGTGTAVEGAKVTLKQQTADGSLVSGLHSLRFSGAGTGLEYATDKSAMQALMGGDFSIQMYVNPNSAVMNTDGTAYPLIDVDGVLSVGMKCVVATNEESETTYSYTLSGSIGGATIQSSTLKVPSNGWSHLSLVYENKTKKLTAYLINGDVILKEVVATVTSNSIWGSSDATSLAIGNTSTFNSEAGFDGYLDEFRLFTKALNETEIDRNYNHLLAGNEEGLAIYYPFDEGIASPTITYDFSRKNGVSNSRHAMTKGTVIGTDVVPSENQLSLMAYTDVNGYYEIRGIPFSGEGTSYSVIPTLGIHEFSPSKLSRFISMSTLNHSGADFEDVSSFPVSGRVFYAGTDYPLEGANFYIDGTICAKDGEMIQTNEQGEFTISVPIGDHFITVKKNGHVFTNGGRYPADPNNVGTKHTFQSEIKNMEFVDETLVNFTGRVVGGDIEGGKSVGFGLSNNNIGVTELILTPLNTVPRMNVVKVESETTFSYETNTQPVVIPSATDKIASESWRGAGLDNCRRFFIRTDRKTGEFSAMLPPLEYAIESIKVVETGVIAGESMTIDLSNPLIEYSDTLHKDDGTDVLYPYNTMLKQVYHSTPTFIVLQQDHEDLVTHENDGAFGIKTYEIEDNMGKVNISDIYSVVNKIPVYKYGGAVFVMNDRYTFDIEAYEEYVNEDGTVPVTDHVPLADLVVTIDNALSSDQIVYGGEDTNIDGVTIRGGDVYELKSNQLMLNEEGKATYSWIAGMPNITNPYTRTISITYDIGERTYQWSGSGLEGIILGSLPTGNNFVTSGPDVVDMILRDPPGSGSSAEWTSGTIYSLTQAKMAAQSFEGQVKTTTKIGLKTQAATGAPGFYKIDDLESKADLELGIIAKEEFEGGDTFSRSIEVTKTISTSDESDYVGAMGDVFIGQATNVIFGAARSVDFKRKSADSNEVELEVEDILTTGLSFGTMFNYTQNYIENELIPNLEKLRNSLLTTVTADVMDNYVNNGASPVYLTTLNPDDYGYGSDNHDKTVWRDAATATISNEGPSYKMIAPNDKSKSYTDTVMWCNSQIANWQSYLALNEQEKVEAYENRNDKETVKDYQNYSFDAGTRVSYSYEKQEDEGYKIMVHGEAGIHVNLQTGLTINKAGVIVDVGTDITAGYKHEREESDGKKVGFSYTLAESGTNDALSVDVYDYGDFSPIFRTRGGQTSAPYEGKVETKYFQPGTTIMDATMQIEVPQIDVDVPIMSDVPTGSAANYTLRLGNASEVNKDVTYILFVLDGTNPDGAQISVDGQVLTEGRRINVPGGQTISKSLQLKQTQEGVLIYDGNKVPENDLYGKGIGVVFASESQPEDIADTVFIKARFTPSSSPVSLALSNSIMNTQTGTDLTLTFKDFDRNYRNLKAFRLQYKKQGATDWTQFKEYVLGEPTGNQEQLPASGASVSYKLPMASFSDGDYMFRVVSASTNGADEVYRYSQELALVKDMQRPTPMGQPEPSDGILNIGDDLSVTFNEEIIKGELTKVANFKVTGVLNGQPVAHWTALSMQNTAATASTEANINLDGKDFSFDAWVNLTAGAGTLLSHGNGTAKMTVGLNGNKQLVVNIAGQSYTSTNTVPTGKWAFLTLSYKNTAIGSVLNASVADDANTTSLFVDKAVVKYNGNGRLTVGNNITGSIHELLLWDEAHDMTTALLNRSKTKNPSTRHLIGYWKMDEGEGTSIRDYSRNRHMTMSAATWYLNNANKSVVLDGSHYLKIDASSLPVCVDDDYAVEFWMRGAAQADAQLLQMGEISLWVKADGTLQFTGKGAYHDAVAVTYATNATNLTDNAWHHIAVNVLRQGATAVYVDGVRCLTVSSANVGSINTNNLLLGVRRITISAETGTYDYERVFTGQVDEVRVWNATMNSDLLLKNRKVRLTGTEDGLVAYYSFETQTLDEGNQIQSVGSAKDLTSNLSAELLAVSDHQSSAIGYSDEAPAMRQKPTETNVSFTFVASNEKVVINIDEDPAIIEGCTLNFTVRDIRDENGNYSVPAVWSAFVNRNELVWEDDELSLEQEVKEGGEISAYVENNGGTQQMWTLSGMPSWLTASSEYGTTNPLSKTEITFYVSPATPIGKYEETVYLKGNDGIETPLTLHVNVTGQVPEWKVNSKDYEVSMNVIGQVMVQGVPMNDADDLVAAFIGDEIRGLAHPVYSSRYDGYYVTMNIYGSSEENNNDTDKPVTFRAYDASTGTLYPEVTAGTQIKFEVQALQGSYANPVVLTASNKIEQSTELKQGWNWLSFYVETDNLSVQTLLSSIADDVEVIKSQTAWLMNENGTWKGGLTALDNEQMYTVKMKADRNLRLVGDAVDPANNVISVGQGWNWIGYYGSQVSSLTDAFAGLIPVTGDILKGQDGVSYYDVFEWSGSLSMMEPGVGYMINVNTARSFSYSSSAVQHAPRRSSAAKSSQFVFNAVDYHNYSGNAIMSAKVMKNGVPMADVELGVFADGECRTVAMTDKDGIAYLTIPGDDDVELRFRIAKGAEIIDANEVITYETDGIYGTPTNPFVVTLGDTTGIGVMTTDGSDDSVYDLQGRKISDGSIERNGIRIVNGQKQLTK